MSNPILQALIGTKVRIARDTSGNGISVGHLIALGFGSDDIYHPETGEENTASFLNKVFNISHLTVSGSILYVGIKEFGDSKAEHNAEHFELIPNIEPEPRTEHDHPPITLGKKLKKPYPNIAVEQE